MVLNQQAPLVWTRVWGLPESPTRIYFDFSLRGIHRLAIKHAALPRERHLVPHPSSPYPKCITFAHYFHSSAELEGTVEITLCRRDIDTFSCIAGLFLRYADGRRACLGEFRMDCICETLEVSKEQELWLGFGRFGCMPLCRDLSSAARWIWGPSVGSACAGREGSSGGLPGVVIARYIMKTRKVLLLVEVTLLEGLVEDNALNMPCYCACVHPRVLTGPSSFAS